MRNRLPAAVSFGLLLAACGSPPLGGVVRSVNGQVISGATVSVEGSQVTATTDSEGRYSLNAPAGTVQVQIRREGFTTESMRITLSPGGNCRAVDVILYPLPPQGAEGVHWVGPTGLLGLRPAHLECRGGGSEALRTDEWVVGDPVVPGALPAVPAGRSSFVVRALSEPVLLKVDQGPAKALLASRVVSSWGIEKERRELVVPVQATRAGKEGLLVLSADLPPGIYLWRDTTRDDPLPPKPAANGSLFRVTADPAGRTQS